MIGRATVLAAALLIGMGASVALYRPAAAEAPIPPGECPLKLEQGRQALVCYCPPSAAMSGVVWGSGPYTDDSEICRAAVHSGAIGEDGGTIRVEERGARDSYEASMRNGVASSNWGAWPRSFIVERATWANATAPDYPARDVSPACPDVGSALGTAGTTLTCRCTAEAAASGTVWGSGPYTTDSAVCRAALHAGLLGPRGGMVSLRAAAGRDGYRGSEANGVSSSDWGSYPTSFEFAQ